MRKKKPTAVYTTKQDMARVWGDYVAYNDMSYYACGLACTPNQNAPQPASAPVPEQPPVETNS